MHTVLYLILTASRGYTREAYNAALIDLVAGTVGRTRICIVEDQGLVRLCEKVYMRNRLVSEIRLNVMRGIAGTRLFLQKNGLQSEVSWHENSWQ